MLCNCVFDDDNIKLIGKWTRYDGQIIFDENNQICMTADETVILQKYRINNKTKTIWIYVKETPVEVLSYKLINDSNLLLILPDNKTKYLFEKYIQ